MPVYMLALFSSLVVWDRSIMGLMYVYDFDCFNWGEKIVMSMYEDDGV